MSLMFVNILKKCKKKMNDMHDIWFPPATEISSLNNSGSIDKPGTSELPSGLRQLTSISL
jgi:hypothetical protein